MHVQYDGHCAGLRPRTVAARGGSDAWYVLHPSAAFHWPAWSGSRAVSGQVAQVGGKVEMWDHQVEAVWESAPHGAD